MDNSFIVLTDAYSNERVAVNFNQVRYVREFNCLIGNDVRKWSKLHLGDREMYVVSESWDEISAKVNMATTYSTKAST